MKSQPKQIVRIAFITFVLATFVMSCSRQEENHTPRHEEYSHRLLAGTWVWDRGPGNRWRFTTTFGSNGHYVCQLEIISSNAVQRRVELYGILEVTNGMLIDTVFSNSQASASSVPQTSRARIIRASEREVVLKWQDMPTNSVLRKEE